jgi:hypothetical protein
LCAAADGEGDVLTSKKPASPTSTWTDVDISGGQSLTSISCPTTTLCVTTSGSGGIITSTDPTGGASGWTTDPFLDPAGSSRRCRARA